MKLELITQMIDGARETLSDAIDAAKDALEYINGESLIAEYVNVYCDENHGTSNGYCGYVDDDGWHRDCDCEID